MVKGPNFFHCSYNRAEDGLQNYFSNKFKGVSKSMYSGVIIKMVGDKFQNCHIIVDVVISNDQSKNLDVLKNP